ncbi:MAG: AMP-binding protein, partial [Acidimicrobiia bacterium]
MLQSTMQDFPLSIGMLFRHGRTVFGSDSEVVTFEGETSRRASYAAVAARADRLAVALQGLGIEPDDRVGTLMWNTQEHLEAYFAIPCIGAVLHTLNIRLFPEQLTYIVNHAAERLVIVDDNLVGVVVRVAAELKTVERYMVVGDGDASPLVEAAPGADVLRYEELLAASDPTDFEYPEVDERAAAAMCYTSGTTGNP